LRVVQLVSPLLQKRERLRRPSPHLKWAEGTKLENTKPPHTIFFSVTEKPYTHQESNNSKNPTLTALKPKEDHQPKKRRNFRERCKNHKKEQSILLLQENPVLDSLLVVQFACLFTSTSNLLAFLSVWISITLSLIQVFFFGLLISFIYIHVFNFLYWVFACF